MLRRSRGKPFEVVGDVPTGLVLAFEPHAERALDRGEDALQRETALIVRLDLLAALNDHRIDDGGRSVVLAAVEDKDALQDPHLIRGEADSARVFHQGRHPLDESPEIVVELLHRPCDHPQRGVGVLADLCQRETPPYFLFGIELLLADLTLDLCHSGHTSGVERSERDAILRQDVRRAETPRDRAEQEALEVDLLESPVAGKPMRRRLRNFRPNADAAVRALGGPLAWMRRLRAIEVGIDEHLSQLAQARDELLAEYAADVDGFARAWRELAESWSFRDVNELIERHNRNFPAEARLPMNPRTGDFVHVNGRPYTREPLDASWILERFPI
jgi:hypothetical protein